MIEERPARLENMPTTFRGFCYHDNDGEEFIVLNARHTRETNRRTWDHERRHIDRGELYEPTYDEYGGMNDEKTDHSAPDPDDDPAGSCLR